MNVICRASVGHQAVSSCLGPWCMQPAIAFPAAWSGPFPTLLAACFGWKVGVLVQRPHLNPWLTNWSFYKKNLKLGRFQSVKSMTYIYCILGPF